MKRFFAMALLFQALIFPPPAARAGGGETAQAQDTVSAAAPADSARARLLTPYWYYRPVSTTTLTFQSRPPGIPSALSGFERYRASQVECALQGAALGSAIGMNAAALGLAAGTWGEKEAWFIGGAVTALGMIYGGIFKADDPKWYSKIRIGASDGK